MKSTTSGNGKKLNYKFDIGSVRKNKTLKHEELAIN